MTNHTPLLTQLAELQGDLGQLAALAKNVSLGHMVNSDKVNRLAEQVVSSVRSLQYNLLLNSEASNDLNGIKSN